MSKYENYVLALDEPVTLIELNTVLKEIGTGVNLDALPSYYPSVEYPRKPI